MKIQLTLPTLATNEPPGSNGDSQAEFVKYNYICIYNNFNCSH